VRSRIRRSASRSAARARSRPPCAVIGDVMGDPMSRYACRFGFPARLRFEPQPAPFPGHAVARLQPRNGFSELRRSSAPAGYCWAGPPDAAPLRKSTPRLFEGAARENRDRPGWRRARCGRAVTHTGPADCRRSGGTPPRSHARRLRQHLICDVGRSAPPSLARQAVIALDLATT